VHGANRLASNSVLEGVVMGRAAAAAVANAAAAGRPAAGSPAAETERFVVAAGALTVAADDDAAVLAGLRSLLWRRAGVVRDEDGLRLGLDELAGFAVAASGEAGRRARDAWEVAGLVLQAALARDESRGAHFRSDRPVADPAQAVRRLVRPRPANTVELVTDPLRPGTAEVVTSGSVAASVTSPPVVPVPIAAAGAAGPTRAA
jgi:L-aspartate oxidase